MRLPRRLRQATLTAACWLLAGVLRPWARPRALPSMVRRILVVRPCCLGDVVMTTAAVRDLAQAFPRARLDYLTTPAAAAALAGNPRVNRVIPLRSGARGYLAALGAIRADHYDLAVVLERAPHWPLLTLLAGIPVRAGLDSHYRGLGLTHRVYPAPTQHEAALASAVVASLGLPVGSPVAEYVPGVAASARAAALLTNHAPRRPRVLLHPGGGANAGMILLAKRWPAERFAKLIVRLVAAGTTPILTGGEDDRPAARAVLAALPPGLAVVDLTGQLDLAGHAALASQCDLYIGHDSGPTHLAAATGAATVVIFGPTDPARYAPLGPRVRVVWRGARLDPAPDLRDRAIDAAAILAVTVDDVWAAARDVLPVLADQPARAEEGSA